MTLLQHISSARAAGHPLLAVLLDPEKPRTWVPAGADWLLVGGSTMAHPEEMERYLSDLRRDCPHTPVVLFPGSSAQFSAQADGLLFLSLLSGRNPRFLIEEQVACAMEVKQSGVEVLPTGYILLDGGTNYTTLQVTQTAPIAMTDVDTIVRTAVAGELLGMRLIYLEAGSGALHPVSEEVIRAVRAAVNIPLIVGGGIRTPEAAQVAYAAGADMLVIGNHFESHPAALSLFCN